MSLPTVAPLENRCSILFNRKWKDTLFIDSYAITTGINNPNNITAQTLADDSGKIGISMSMFD